ncbi:hypothetical protein GGF37_000367, partial [Kickxella alabastrina]
HYHNTQTLGKSRKHAGRSSTDSLHRKLHYLSFVNRKRADVKLAKSLHAKFGPDPVLILDNWAPGMARYHEPIRGKGVREMLIGQRFIVYLIDEYCISTFYPVSATTSATANSVAAAAAAVSIAIKTAAAAASISNSEQHSCDKWMPIRPQSAGIIRWIGKEKGWSEDKIDSIIKQQVQDELAEGYREHYINIQLADNLKRIVRLSGWSRGKIERKIRQRMRDELAAQQQHQKHGQQHRVAATGVNTIPAV